MPGAVHQIEKGMMGWDPNRPTENPSLLLLLALHSQGPLEIKDQHTTRETARETEIERDGPKKVSRVSRKDAMNQRNPCGRPLITKTPGLLLVQRTVKGISCRMSVKHPLRVRAASSIRCQMKYLPTSTPS